MLLFSEFRDIFFYGGGGWGRRDMVMCAVVSVMVCYRAVCGG